MTKDSLAVAIEALSWMAYAGLGERTALFRAAEQIGVSEPDELRQAHRLIMETTRYQNRLEFILTRIMPKEKLQRTPHGIGSFLKILAYLCYVKDARPREISATVEAARQILGWEEMQGYERLLASIASSSVHVDMNRLPEFERISLETCHPVWFIKRLTHTFGRDAALQMLRRNLEFLPTFARINPLKVHDSDRSRMIQELSDSVFDTIQDVLKLTKSLAAVRSRYFASGEIVIQDLSSIVAGLAATPAPGSTVLDVCAAPGNKTSHLAALMQNNGSIYSVDVSNRRLSHWTKEMKRTGVRIASPIRSDARRIPLKVAADLVLIDPPCSNSGVFARNPAAKWKITESRVHEFSISQRVILQAGSMHVRPRGSLVYCTCSVLPEENEYVIEEFLRNNQEFRLVPQAPFLGSHGLRGFELCQRFYPHLHSCNGYFIAKLQRTG